MAQINVPKFVFRDRVFNQYQSVPFAIMRELAQNSSDAGASFLKIETADHKYTAYDNGRGMRKDQVEALFLTVNGTDKKGDESKTGAFGAAKECLVYWTQKWMIEGQGFRIVGSGIDYDYNAPYHNRWERDENGDVIVTYSPPTGRNRGFLVAVEDKKLLDYQLKAECERLVKRSFIPNFNVYLNGKLIPMGRPLTDEMLIKEWNWGKLYVYKGRRNSEESENRVYVRTRGIYTCYHYAGGIPYTFYLDITAKSTDILYENRDSLKSEYRDQVDEAITKLVKDPRKLTERKNPLIKVFNLASLFKRVMAVTENRGVAVGGQAVSVGGTVVSHHTRAADMDDVAQAVDRKEKKTVTNSNGQERDVEFVHEMMNDFPGPFAILADGKRKESEAYKGKRLKPEVVKALRILDLCLNDVRVALGLPEGVYVVPALLLNDDDDYTGVHCRVMDGVHLIGVKFERVLEHSTFAFIHTIIHEVVHVYVDHHGDEFASCFASFTATYGDRFFVMDQAVKGMRQM